MEKLQPDTISDAGLGPEEFLVIHIGDELSNKEVGGDTIRTKESEMWFFQVADVVPIRYQPYTLKDDNGNDIGPLAPESGTNYQRLFDSGGNDILRVEDQSWRVYHLSLGVMQDDIRVYPRIPDNQNGGGFDYLTGSQPDPQGGEPMGYVPGDETDYDDPTTDLETVSWRSSSLSPIQYGFYNENSQKDIEPILSVKGFAYELRPVETKEERLQLLADVSRVDTRPDAAVRTVSFSKSALESFSFSVPSSWRDAENNLSVGRANLPENIEEQAGGEQ